MWKFSQKDEGSPYTNTKGKNGQRSDSSYKLAQ